jgi:undecaprenyl-diphosphatase
MKKKNRILLWILVIISIIVSLYFDTYLVRYISYLRNNILDNFFLFITFIGSEAIILVILTVIFWLKKNKRKWIIPLWVTFGISAITGFILKITIQRPRPFQLNIIQLVSGVHESFSWWDFSFPSFHSMFAFCALPILSITFPKLKKVWITLAILIAFSRVYLGLHFVSDVIAGAALGYLVGRIVVKIEKEYKFGEKIYSKIFRK